MSQHLCSFLKHLLELFRVSPEIFLGLLYAVDVDEGYHCTVDLVVCSPVRPYPDGIPAAVVVFDFYFLGGNAVYYIGNQRADIGGLRVQIDVDNRTSDIGRDQVEHLLCMGGETAYPKVVAQHDDRQVRANKKVCYVIIDLGEFYVPVL